jgi:hypothetical protein
MQTKKKLIIPALAVALAFSCNKKEMLNPIPTTSISDASAFDTPDRVANQVRALYGNFKSGNLQGGRYLIYNDIRGEDFQNELTNAVTGFSTWNYSLTNTAQEVTGLWNQAYLAINSCNVFMDGMAAKGTALVGDALSKNYLAEARLIRAMCYYDLLQLYARPYWDGNGSKPGLPIRTTGNKGPANYDLARSTVDQVYSLILEDLNFAETNLPLNNTTAALNTTRAHRNTALALKTRVYLSMGKYAEVITTAEKFVGTSAPFTATSGVPNALQADITAVFKPPYTTTESIFSLPFASNETPGGQNQLGYYYSPLASQGGVGNGEYSLNQSGIIADADWLATDKRRAFVFTSPNSKKWLIKYNTASPYTDYAPVIRYAEVLLNLAEARVRSSNTVDAQAIALLNAVHLRSEPTTPYTAAGFANANTLATAILRERRIEFLGEGLRSPDLLRLGLPIPAKGSVSQIAPTDSRYIWPISSIELLLNPLATDN